MDVSFFRAEMPVLSVKDKNNDQEDIMKKMFFLFIPVFLAGGYLYATPSTQVWNPSADIQEVNTLHFGIDNYFSISGNDSRPYSLPTLVGLTYGAMKNVEIGLDYSGATAYPLQFNAKYGLPERAGSPAFALGVMNIGAKRGVTDYDILYGVAAKTIGPLGRFSIGCYAGNKKLLVDENKEEANTGVIATWDKTIADKVWAAVDYASGMSYYGCTSVGVSYAFSSGTSVIFGYIVYNNSRVNINNQFTTQLDINY
jgi:hypothetical protein